MPEDREELLLSKLFTESKMSVQDAMDLLNVSKSTVRRIFINLENRGIAVRAYGGIQLASSTAVYSFDTLKRKFSNEKVRIGKAACEIINEDDILFIDAGTTSMNFAFQLSQAIVKGSVKVKAVFTNSISTLEVLAPAVTVNLVGGEYRPQRKDCYGYLSEMVIERLHFTKCFLGTDGVIGSTSFAAMDFTTAAINAALMKSSSRNIVLCDHSKFFSTSYVAWASFSEVDTVITDAGLSEKMAAVIRNEGCGLILA